MPGQKISTLTPVSDLQAADQFPLARSGSTYKISGDKFASKAQLDSLSAAATGSFALKTDLNALSANPFVAADTSTIDLTLTNRTLSASVFDSSITNSKLAFDGGSFAFRNKLINGNFDIWQRGTTLASGTGWRYLADRFVNNSVGSTYTVSQQSFSNGQTDVPNNPSYFHRTVVSSVAGNVNLCALLQSVEFVKTLSGKTATLSFYAKADSAKPISIEFVQGFGTGGTPSSVVTGIGVQKLNLTTSWQKFTVTANIPSITGKTIGTDGNDYLSIIFWFNAGSDFNARTNSLGQQSGTFDIAQVQLEEGSVATPFEIRPIGTELSLCQRYYTQNTVFLQRYATTAYFGGARSDNMFKVSMRAVPTLTIWSGGFPRTGTQGSLTVNEISTSSSFIFSATITQQIVYNNGGLPNVGDYGYGSFEASAEL